MSQEVENNVAGDDIVKNKDGQPFGFVSRRLIERVLHIVFSKEFMVAFITGCLAALAAIYGAFSDRLTKSEAIQLERLQVAVDVMSVPSIVSQSELRMWACKILDDVSSPDLDCNKVMEQNGSLVAANALHRHMRIGLFWCTEKKNENAEIAVILQKKLIENEFAAVNLKKLWQSYLDRRVNKKSTDNENENGIVAQTGEDLNGSGGANQNNNDESKSPSDYKVSDFSSQFSIIYDKGHPEMGAFATIVSLIQENYGNVIVSPMPNIGDPTPWYVSIVICKK